MTPVFWGYNTFFFFKKRLILAYMNQNVSIKQELTETELNDKPYGLSLVNVLCALIVSH